MRLRDIVGEPPADAFERQQGLVSGCRRVLAGEHPIMQGTALAELLALWLAGHQVEAQVHEELLAAHMDAVRALLPLAQEEIGARLRAAGGAA